MKSFRTSSTFLWLYALGYMPNVEKANNITPKDYSPMIYIYVKSKRGVNNYNNAQHAYWWT